MYLKTLWIIAVIVGVQAHPLSNPVPRIHAGAPPVAILPVLPGSPTAQGSSDSKVLTGETVNPDGSVSKTVQQGSSTGGSAAFGGLNVGHSSSETQSLSNALGTSTTSDTDASSIQSASPGFHGFNANLGLPAGHQGVPAWPTHPGFPAMQTHPGFGFGSPTAQGTSGSNVLTGETFNPDGSVSKTVQQGSSTGGSAAGGGTNIGRTSSETQSVSNALGTSTSSDTDASSIQTASPGFHGFNANLGLPAGHQGAAAWPSHPGFPHMRTHPGFPQRQTHPGFGFGSPTAQGASDSKVLTGETINPDGSVSKTVQQGSSTGGSAAEGGFNIGHTSSETQSLSTPHETRTTSDTAASSIQGASQGFRGFNPNLGFPAGQTHPGFFARQSHPGFPAIQTHPGFGFGSPTAEGTSGSNVLTGQTFNPDGSISKTVQQGSSTGGSAAGGGTNIGRTSSETQTVSNALGTSTSSDTDAVSMQGASHGFHGFNANLGFPAGHQGIPGWPTHPGFHHRQPHPGFGFGSPTAQGASDSKVLTGETFNPDGSTSKTVQQGSSTGGSAAGTGFNVGHTSSDTQSLSTPHETRTTSDTDALSIQGAGAVPGHFGFGQFAPLSAHPSLPVFPGHGFGSATGKADSALTRTEEQRPDGSTSKLTVLGSSAGGSAEGGGTSVSKSSGGTSSIHGAGGSQTQSRLESTSAQSGR